MSSTQNTQANYPRGSEWRKWDLQVHTPHSVLNNQFGSDFEAYAKRLIEKACDDSVSVVGVGITDYFTIEGYKALRHLLRDKHRLERVIGRQFMDRVDQMLFIPNVELRSSIVVQNKGQNARINFHVFFSDSVSPEDIEEQFLHELKFAAEADPDGQDESWPLKERHLAELGKRLKRHQDSFNQHSDLFVGMMNAVIDHKDVSAVLDKKPSIFKDQYLICVPCDEDLSKLDWKGQAHLTRKLLIQKSHVLFSSNMHTRAFGLGKKHSSPEEFKAEFKGLKPCIHSSDSHTYDEMFLPKDSQYTWIKADPTFQGLRQILNEPEERIFIGDVPPSLTRASRHPTRIIKSVDIGSLSTESAFEEWFDCDLPLNNELVAIIGNKGSGKSALSDILGLLGNTPRYESFSFLSENRFRNPRNNKARRYQATLTWADGTKDASRRLDVDPDLGALERIKYIPQNYLEDICNEIELGDESKFNKELRQVIFSHVNNAEKLGFETLDELLAYRTEETTQSILELVQELQEINGLVVAAEEEMSVQHKNAIEAQLAEKKRELEAHNQTRPSEVPKPDIDSSAQHQTNVAETELADEQSRLDLSDKEIAELQREDAAAAKKHSAVEKLIAKINNLQRYVDGILSETALDFDELEIAQSQVVTFATDTTVLAELREKIANIRSAISVKLDPQVDGSLTNVRDKTLNRISSLQIQLSAPQKLYQAFLNAIKEWEHSKSEIVGSTTIAGSVKHLEKELANLELVPAYLADLRRRREKKVIEIYRAKQKLRAFYKAYYGGVQAFLLDHPLAAEVGFQLSFNVSITDKDFADSFLNRLNRRKIGPFMGDEEGRLEMKRLLNSTNFDSAAGTLRFVRKLFTLMRERTGQSISIKDQLRQSVSVQDLYDYVYSLGFLSPSYNLRWDGKNLAQLSPGERGNLLLIFYLLVDRSDIPLIIDQPEENLDNQTVFRTLVPCVKDAKKRRQIVLVTHNPNLAVVCDAEQIVCADMSKGDNHKITYSSGSIENSVINRNIIDILEGTRPAFDKRDDKYIPEMNSSY